MLNQLHADASGDPETVTRIQAYEMAFPDAGLHPRIDRYLGPIGGNFVG